VRCFFFFFPFFLFFSQQTLPADDLNPNFKKRTQPTEETESSDGSDARRDQAFPFPFFFLPVPSPSPRTVTTQKRGRSAPQRVRLFFRNVWLHPGVSGVRTEKYGSRERPFILLPSFFSPSLRGRPPPLFLLVKNAAGVEWTSRHDLLELCCFSVFFFSFFSRFFLLMGTRVSLRAFRQRTSLSFWFPPQCAVTGGRDDYTNFLGGSADALSPLLFFFPPFILFVSPLHGGRTGI